MTVAHVNALLPQSVLEPLVEGGATPLSFPEFVEKLSSKSTCWSRAEDECVSKYLALLCRKHSTDPFRLNLSHLSDFSFIYSIRAMGESVKDNFFVENEENLKLIFAMQDLLRSHSDVEVTIRMVLLIHLNDTILPLLPLLAPYSSFSAEGSTRAIKETSSNFPSAKIKAIRRILFPTVRSNPSLPFPFPSPFSHSCTV
jgi:hypothetical protein